VLTRLHTPRRPARGLARLSKAAPIVVALTLVGAAPALAVDNPTDSAAVSQYSPPPTETSPPPQTVAPTPTPTPTPSPAGDVQDETNSGGPTSVAPPAGGVKDETASGAPATQPAQQVEAQSTSGDTLPFTGWVIGPVLVAGVVALMGGLLLRRRTSQD
jgi:hypothetical protein